MNSLILVSLLLHAQPAAATPKSSCTENAMVPELMVKGQTTVRRGPGPNYPSVTVLKKNQCFKMGEVSMDETWVLIEGKGLFGWVPTSRLSKSSRSKVSAVRPDRAPVGSGQTRGYVWTNQSTNLKETPQSHSKTMRLVAQGERVLALAATGDGVWIQVRDLRGEQGWIRARRIRDETGVLAGVPRTSRGVRVETVRLEEGPQTRTVLVPMQQGVLIDAELSLGTTAPLLSLDSNGEDFFRRYEITALAPAAKIKAITTSVEPLLLSFEYSWAFLSGLSTDIAEGNIGGYIQDADLRLGWPMEIGGFWLMPQLGYFFSEVNIDPILPQDPIDSGGSFFSYRTHALRLGLRTDFKIAKNMRANVDIGGIAGDANEFPLDLGRAGWSIGGGISFGVRYALTDEFALIMDAHTYFQNSPFEGESLSDRSVTQASLSRSQTSVFMGAVFAL